MEILGTVIICVVIVLIFAATGYALNQEGLKEVQLAKDSFSWPSVKGKIIKSILSKEIEKRVEKHIRDDNDRRRYVIMDRHESSRETESVTWRPFIRYSYTVNDKKYTSSNKDIFNSISGCGFSNQADAEIYIEEYPLDKEVTVYYNPTNPSQCCLETGNIKKGESTLRLSIICFAIAAGLAVFFLGLFIIN